MNASVRWSLGLLSALPLICFLFLLFAIPALAETNHGLALSLDTWVDRLMKLTLLLALVFSVAHLIKTTSMTKETKILWGAVLFLGNFLALPFYWFFRVRPKQQAQVAQ